MIFEPWMKTFYHEHGYLVVKQVLTTEDMAAVSTRTDEIVKNPATATSGVSVGHEGDTIADKSSLAAKNNAVRGTAFLVRFDPVFQMFTRNTKILELVRGLLGLEIKLFRDQMLLKPPGGQAKPVHQDQSYFRVQPMDDLVTAWVALDDATRENGCMCYVPGSHKHGIFEVDKDPDRPVHHIPNTRGVGLPDPVYCPVPAGSIIFHHGCTLHSSDVNRTDSWRRAVILHFTTAAARSEVDRLNEEVSLEID